MPPALWGFLGIFAGGWKLALVAAALIAFFGRRFAPFASRWLSLTNQRRTETASSKSQRSRFGDRVYLLLVVMAATAVAVSIIAHYTLTKGGR